MRRDWGTPRYRRVEPAAANRPQPRSEACAPQPQRQRRPELPAFAIWRRVLAQLFALADGKATLLEYREQDWASATFNGTRHTVDLAFVGPAAITAAEHLIAQLPDHEFAIKGQIVIDATVSAAQHRLLPEPELSLTCELLLLQES